MSAGETRQPSAKLRRPLRIAILRGTAAARAGGQRATAQNSPSPSVPGRSLPGANRPKQPKYAIPHPRSSHSRYNTCTSYPPSLLLHVAWEQTLTSHRQGYEADHPNIQLLRLRNFTLGCRLKEDEVLGANLLHRTLEIIGALKPFVSAKSPCPASLFTPFLCKGDRYHLHTTFVDPNPPCPLVPLHDLARLGLDLC